MNWYEREYRANINNSRGPAPKERRPEWRPRIHAVSISIINNTVWATGECGLEGVRWWKGEGGSGPRKRPSLVLAHQSRSPREREGVMGCLHPKRYIEIPAPWPKVSPKGKPHRTKGTGVNLYVSTAFRNVWSGRSSLLLYDAANRQHIGPKCTCLRRNTLSKRRTRGSCRG